MNLKITNFGFLKIIGGYHDEKAQFFLPILLAILFSTNIAVKSNPPRLRQKRTASQAGLKQQDQASRKKRTKVNEENHRNVGLGNTESNCYFNVVIQCLSNLPIFRSSLLQNESLYKNDQFISGIITLIKDLRKTNKDSITNHFVINSVVKLIKQQQGNSQEDFQDAYEFI